MRLPENEYDIKIENGKKIIYTTLRQKVFHTIGLDHNYHNGRLYTRHGKKYYKPYRNYFSGNDKDLDRLVEAGYMECRVDIVRGEEYKTYWFNRKGLDWLGEKIGVIIKDEEN